MSRHKLCYRSSRFSASSELQTLNRFDDLVAEYRVAVIASSAIVATAVGCGCACGCGA